jgi:hypothetical protein
VSRSQKQSLLDILGAMDDARALVEDTGREDLDAVLAGSTDP